jgi:predicted RNA binding protein YcfA (HicA-like mRNA interferase family)
MLAKMLDPFRGTLDRFRAPLNRYKYAGGLRRCGEAATVRPRLPRRGGFATMRQCWGGTVQGGDLKFSELVRELERSGFVLVKEKGSIRYYAKTGWPNLIRIDYHGSKEVPTGTCHSILKAAGIRKP